MIDIFFSALRIIGDILWILAPVWVPVLLWFVFFHVWLTYIRARFIAEEEHILLEIRIPREITKTPLAMELVLNTLHQTGGESNWWFKYVKGTVRRWFSLELVSIGGEIHFFVWTRKKFASQVEAAFYSQYPNVEVVEVEDYTTLFSYNKEVIDTWGCEYDLTKPDAYPIKTYIDYGLDKPQKEEEKTDPLASVIEFLGACKPNEQIWFQILIQAHKSSDKSKKGTWFKKTSWQKEAKDLINDLMRRDPDTYVPKAESQAEFGGESYSFRVMPAFTDEEKHTIEAIERSTSKHGFNTGIRALYMCPAGEFDVDQISGIVSAFKHYSSETLNGFKPARGSAAFPDYPWDDYKNIRRTRAKRMMFDAYRRRSYFHAPYKSPVFVLNTEELATIFHLPGDVVQSPMLDRIEAKKSEPPVDLPI